MVETLARGYNCCWYAEEEHMHLCRRALYEDMNTINDQREYRAG